MSGPIGVSANGWQATAMLRWVFHEGSDHRELQQLWINEADESKEWRGIESITFPKGWDEGQT